MEASVIASKGSELETEELHLPGEYYSFFCQNF